MKNLSQVLTPVGWLFIYISSYVPVYVLFSPSLKEFLIMLFVDFVVTQIYLKQDAKIVEKIASSSKYFYKKIHWDELEALNENEKLEVFKQLTQFPLKRAIYGYFGSFLKSIPAILVMVFYWQHDTSNWQQFITIFLMIMVTFCYFYGAVYIETHIFLSETIAELHRRFNWSEVFSKAKVKNQNKEFFFQEALALFFIIFFVLGLQLMLLSHNRNASLSIVSFKVFILGMIGILLFFRIWYLGRTFITGGLEVIFNSLQKFEIDVGFKPLALHTAGILADFEKTFNDLAVRLKSSELDLYELVFNQAEISRYHTIGEISGLIAHDLTNPLNAAKYFVTRIKAGDAPEKMQNYMDFLEQNLDESLGLVSSLRARLKNTEQIENLTNFNECYQHVHKLLKTQFYTEGFTKINFHVDLELLNISIKLPRVDFIHILDNLIRNSINNLIDNKISEPMIRFSFVEINSDEQIVFKIDDNGTGLNQTDFQQLGDNKHFSSEKTIKSSLGLKLTKRLIEFHNGSIFINDRENLNQGTTFVVSLPGKKNRR